MREHILIRENKIKTEEDIEYYLFRNVEYNKYLEMKKRRTFICTLK